LLSIINVCNLIQGNDDFKDLYSVPHLIGDKKACFQILAILVQNAHHQSNGGRVLAIKKGQFVEIKDDDSAMAYLKRVLSVDIQSKLKSEEAESDLMKDSSDRFAEQILLAPDQYYAAAIMKHNNFSVGRGDFRKILSLLGTKNEPNYKDIGNKLKMIKNGCLSQESKANVCVYSDKNRQIVGQYGINHKHVFKIWSTQVFSGKSLA